MKKKSFFILIFSLLSIIFAHAKKIKKAVNNDLNVGVYGGFGKCHLRVGGRYTEDGRRVNTEQYFLKSFKVVTKYQLLRKLAIGIDIGLVYDYGVGYRLESNNQSSGFGISSPNAMTFGYTLWHVAVNCYQNLYSFGRLKLAGYAGTGLQIFTSENYPKEEIFDSYHPDDPNKYYSLPSTVNKHPIVLFNVGLDLNYTLGKRSLLTFQPSLRFGTKKFITDIVRIETPTYNHTVLTSMNGTNAILSVGYSYRIR